MNKAHDMNSLSGPNGHLLTETMSLALDAMLDLDEQRRFDEHLSACSECQLDWTMWQRVATALHVEPFVGPAPGFSLRVDEHIQQHEQRRERLLGGLVLIGGALSVWTLMLVGLVVAAAIILFISPGIRLQVIHYLGFMGQFLALLPGGDLSGLLDGLAANLPGPLLLVAAGIGMVLMVLLWGRLSPVHSAGANGRLENGFAASVNGASTDINRGD